MKIVSANYLDRRSEKPWLIRDASEPASKALAVASVTATGVVFCPASDWEVGFGCFTVAHCTTAEEGGPEEPIGERLHFRGHDFLTEAGVRVPRCHQLQLRPDGSMWAVIEAPVAAETREMAEA